MNQLNEIDVKNFMRIRTATLKVEGNTLVVSGDNASGKSSFLTAIENLFGGKDRQPPQPVRKGAKESVIVGRMTCADGRKLKATVTIKAPDNQRRLVVTDEAGVAQDSPQTLLNSFWAATSFDPTLFLASQPADQVIMLKKLAKLDFSELDKDRAMRFQQRHATNQSLQTARGHLASMPSYPNAPKVEVSVSDISEALKDANAKNKANSDAESALRERERELVSAANVLNLGEGQVRELEAALEKAKAGVDFAKRSVLAAEKSKGEAIAALALAPKVDTAPLMERMSSADGVNSQVRSNAAREKAAANIQSLEAESDKLTAAIDAIDEKKQEQLQAAPFPVKGLAFDDRGATFNGLPLEQASDSEKIAIGVQMAAAMNPGKPLMLIRHGNLFTDKNFHVLNEIAESLGLTCIIEVAGPKRSDSVLVFEDGVGHAPDEPEAPPAEGGKKEGELL